MGIEEPANRRAGSVGVVPAGIVGSVWSVVKDCLQLLCRKKVRVVNDPR